MVNVDVGNLVVILHKGIPVVGRVISGDFSNDDFNLYTIKSYKNSYIVNESKHNLYADHISNDPVYILRLDMLLWSIAVIFSLVFIGLVE